MDSPSNDKRPVCYALPGLDLDASPNPAPKGRQLTGFNIAEALQKQAMDPNTTHRAISPAKSTSAFTYKLRRSWQLSSDTIHTPRPKLGRNAATAPPGALYLFSAVPPPPRRAISAEVSRPGRNRIIDGRQSSIGNALMPRVSINRTPASRSSISRGNKNRKYVGKSGLKPINSVWRVPPPTTSKNYRLISEAMDIQKNSSSEKARMKKTLKDKKVEFLNTNIVDFGALDLPDTPGSMVSTPREMYGIPAEDALFKSHPGPGKRRLLPTSRVEHFPLPLSPDLQRCEFIARSDSVLTVRTTNIQSTACRQQVYVPGFIRLEEKVSATRRKDSISTLEPFTSEAEGGRKRFSDIVALDDIVSYFYSLGVLDEAGEDGLDKYWEHKGQANPTSPRRPTAALPVLTRPPSLALPSSSSIDVFPLMAVKQQEETQSLPSPNFRQRIKLKRFLHPATSML